MLVLHKVEEPIEPVREQARIILKVSRGDQPRFLSGRGRAHRSYLLTNRSWRTATAMSGLSLNSPSTPSL